MRCLSNLLKKSEREREKKKTGNLIDVNNLSELLFHHF